MILTFGEKVQAALDEKVIGKTLAFTEKAYREKYRAHLDTIVYVKRSAGDGERKHTRMMSNIYQGVM